MLAYYSPGESVQKSKAIYTAKEKSLILELVKRKASIINCKDTRRSITSDKRKAWVEITMMFNANPLVQKKDAKQIETFYRNWKKRLVLKNKLAISTGTAISNIKQETQDKSVIISESNNFYFKASDLSVEGKEAGDAEVSSASTLSESGNQELEVVHESLLTEKQTDKVTPEPQKRSCHPKIAKSKALPNRRSIVFKNVLTEEDWETTLREAEERRKEERHQLLQQQTREAIDQARELHESALKLSRAKIEEVKARTAIHEAQAKYWRERNEDVLL